METLFLVWLIGGLVFVAIGGGHLRRGDLTAERTVRVATSGLYWPFILAAALGYAIGSAVRGRGK